MTITIRSGIPTTYRGTNFRSRLEARWAAMFDLVGWSWTYEPVDADGYIPDFLIAGARPLFVEVGPCITTQDYHEKAAKPDDTVHQLRQDVLVVGASVSPDIANGCGHPSAGLLGEFWEHDQHDPDWCLTDCRGRTVLSWAAGIWTTCIECKRTGVTHDTDSFVVRPCGHYPGGHINRLALDVRDLWAEAGNATQWRPR